MRTLILVLAGLAILGGIVAIARSVATHHLRAAGIAVRAFLGVWFLVAAANLWIGVTQAGYSVVEELPVFFVIFGVPAAVAVYVLRGRSL
jgi:hypothetical protein